MSHITDALYTIPACYARGVQNSLRPGILLDRDGTLIDDTGYPGRPEHVKFLPGAPEAVRSFNEAGIPVALITNQGGVAYGYHSIDDVEATHRYIASYLAEHGAHIDLYLFCPYHPNGTVKAFARHSEDRKPAPGMAIAAAKALDLDLTRSWVAGDRREDIDLARHVGAFAVYIGPGTDMPQCVPFFPGLADAAPYILERIAG